MSAPLTSDTTLKEVLKHTGHLAPEEKAVEPLTQILEDSDDIENLNITEPICLEDVTEEEARAWTGKKVVFHCNNFEACGELFKGVATYEINNDIHLDTYQDEWFVIDFSGKVVYVNAEETAAFKDWYIKVLK